MTICFANKEIRKICETSKEADRRLGKPCADKLRRRLADLEAAQTVRDLVAGRPHPLSDGSLSIVLQGGFRLVFEADLDPIPQLTSGGIDWAKVDRIIITYIGDYHD